MREAVSVVIPTYNYGRFIAEAIQSALAQTHSPSEIIVIDDGSTDGTEAAVRRFRNAVLYLRQENAGVCAARNRGVAESKGKFVAFLDADDIWEPTKIEMQLAKFVDDPEIGLVHCGMREFESQTGATLKLHIDGQDGWVSDELLLWERPAVIVSGSAVMVSRKAFDRAGGFDTRQKVGEDWDFCYRVARQFKVAMVREPLVNYRSHGAAAHRNVREMERGMKIFYAKAFAEGDERVLALRRRSLGNYHRVLAGSYYTAGEYVRFVRHAALSVWNRPGNLGFFLEFPLRKLRQTKNPAGPKTAATPPS